MINFPLFIEGLLIPLVLLLCFAVYKRSKRKKNKKVYNRPTKKLQG